MKELLTTNKKAKYFGDSRYEKVWEQMKLLGIQDVSTKRQDKNGTIVWKLPIRVHTAPSITKFIEVASFSTGYVRNQNSGYSNYQLNKRCESEPQYYKCTNKHDGSDLYRKFTTRTCKLIPIEIDRLEYLISYCLKNYFIKNANQIANGEYISKWGHEWELERQKEKSCDELADFRNEVQDCGHYDRIRDLENKLDTIQRIADHG